MIDFFIIQKSIIILVTYLKHMSSELLELSELIYKKSYFENPY